VIEAVAAEFPYDRIGVRLSPYGTFNDMGDSDTAALFNAAIQKLNGYGLSYLHMIEPRSTTAGGNDKIDENAPDTAALFRKAFKGPFISAGGYTRDSGEQALVNGAADAIAYGRLYISNPDLAERFALNAPLNPYDRGTFYGGAEKAIPTIPVSDS